MVLPQETIDALKSFFNRFFMFAVILVITFFVARTLRKLMDRYFKKASKIMKTDPTSHGFIKHLTSAIIYIAGIGLAIYTIPELRTLSVSLFAGAGVLAVVLGFAAQQAFSNVISGIFLVIFKPYKVGDRIKLRTDLSGIVEEISLRHTIIRNFENKRFIIPNAVISNEVIENSTFGDETICRWVEFSISYDSDIDKAMKIMKDEAMKHPNFIDNRTREEKKEKKSPVTVKVIGFGDSSVNLRAMVWCADAGKAFELGTDLNRSIKLRFDKEGIEIPYPYRTIVYKKEKTKLIHNKSKNKGKK